MFKLLKNYVITFWLNFFLFALPLMNGQYSRDQQCDHNRLQRCQQDTTTNIQDLSSQGTQGSYSGMSSGYQSSGHSSDTVARCSAIRQNLDCLLMYTPSCQSNRPIDTRGSMITDNRNNGGDFVRRARQTLERYCEDRGSGWRQTVCFTRSDVRNCENQYSFTSNPPSVTSTACRNYQDFRDCVIRIVRQSCYSQDLQLMATYLYDKAADLSWSCVLNPDYSNPRSDSHYPNDPSRDNRYNNNNNPNYDNRGTNYNPNYGTNYNPSGGYDRNSQYDRNNQGSNYDPRGGTNYNYGSSSGSLTGSNGFNSQNQPIDRFGGYYPTTDSCLEKAGYFVRSCEDTLIQRQRDAREGRSSNDVQRRICCALFFYRDCISRVVVDRCRDPSPTVVDILMGSRKRDLTVTCREYSRDQCSASSKIQTSFSLFLSLLIAFSFLKSNIF